MDEGVEMENEQEWDLFGFESEEESQREDAAPHAEELDEDNEALFGDGDARPGPGGAQRESEPTESKFLCEPCEARVPFTLKAPVKPSAEEISKHNATHLPYRNWCPICVRAKGREDAHYRGANIPDDDDKDGVPVVSMDYNTVEGEKATGGHAKKVKTVVVKDEVTGCVFQHRIDCKGTGDEWLMKRLCKDFEELGRRDIVLKTDGEPAMVAVQSRIQGMRPGRTILRNPPAYNPQSNGPCEKAVQDATAHARALRLALESRLGVEIPRDSPIMDWIFEHAAFLINRFSVGHDGMVPMERLTGTKWRRAVVEIGETVLAKLVNKPIRKGKEEKQKKKLAERSVQAVWVGQMARTGEHVVIGPNGDALRCRTVRRVPTEERWCAERVLRIRATPRHPTPSRRRSDTAEPGLVGAEAAGPGAAGGGPDATSVSVEPGADCGVGLPQPEARAQRETDVRELRITDRVLEKFGGFLSGCPGCEWKASGMDGHRGHSQRCRQRLYDEMEKTVEGRQMLEESRRRIDRRAANRHDDHQPRAGGAGDHDRPQPPGRGPPEHEGDDAGRDHELRMGQNCAPQTPRFGDDAASMVSEGSDGMNVDGIEQLDEETAHRASENGEEETNIEPSTKRQRIAPVHESQRHLRASSKANALKTEVGKTIAGHDDGGNEKAEKEDPRVAALRGTWEAEINDCLLQLKVLEKHANVRKILEDIEKTAKTPVNRRQRRTMNAGGRGHVAEIYSPPRVVSVAEEMGLDPAWSLDLTQLDEEDGLPWDFSRPEKRERARDKLKSDKPFMLVLSPMCGPFSAIQNLNYVRMQDSEVRQLLADGMEHVRFAIELAVTQHRHGRLFMFEHPVGASSWHTRTVEALENMEGVYKVNFDFCQMGMRVGERPNDANKELPAKKRTSVLTNSHALHLVLREAQCRGDHLHGDLLDGKAAECQKYPRKFCKVICEAVKRELDTVKWRNRLCKQYDVTNEVQKLMKIHEKLEEMETPPEEDVMEYLYEGMEFVDDITGAPLDKSQAVKARKEEMEYFRRMKVYTKVKREKWMKVITCKWIDQNKGDEANPNLRARLVGRELAKDKREDLFAATPPLESLKMILSIAASHQLDDREDERYIVMSNDVKRAYFYAPATRPIYIQIPVEDREPGDEDRVGVLNLSLYGTRDAAMNWAARYTDLLRSLGFHVGKASPCNFVHEERGISLTVHGDDFTSTGKPAHLRWLGARLAEEFDVKTEFLGPGRGCSQQIRVLNRVICWTADGITYEADQRHAEIVIEELGLTGAKTVATPGTREDAARAGPPTTTKVTGSSGSADGPSRTDVSSGDYGYLRFEDVPLEPQELLAPSDASRYKGLAARLNYLAQDRPDVQYAVKEVARRMSKPTTGDWGLLKRLGRYLLGAPRALQTFRWQAMPTVVNVYVDSDWAGCHATCRSTSGGAVLLGDHCLKSWSTTQATVAMSSGEAELFSLTKGAAQALGLIAMALDLGQSIDAVVHSDASAALAIAQRKGLGKVRHLKVQYLWIQDRIKHGDLAVMKVWGKDNPADLMTKHLSAAELQEHSARLGFTLSSSRASAAPRLAVVSEQTDAWERTADGQVGRRHERPRRALFTPLRVEGAPPARALTSARITRGRFIDNGEEFVWRDNWTARAAAHRDLGRRWTGVTEFLLKGSC